MYSAANQEYDSGNPDGYKDAAECYVLAGVNNPPTNNPALLACIRSVGEESRYSDEKDKEAHDEAHKCVNELDSIINLTQEEADALLGRHAESRGLVQEAINHYADAGMPYDVGRIYATQARRLEWIADGDDGGYDRDHPYYYINASEHYEASGDLDGALRTSVKTLAEERHNPKWTSSSEVQELKRILALLEAKKSFYVQEFPAE